MADRTTKYHSDRTLLLWRGPERTPQSQTPYGPLPAVGLFYLALPMTPEEKLKQAIEIIESAIADFEKLTPFIGGAATATAEIYREERKKLEQ